VLADERFALLIVRGTPPCQAHRIAYPKVQNHSSAKASEVMNREHIATRIEVLRQEIAMRTVVSMEHKRDLLSQMALCETPTEIIELPGGKQIRKFQPLAALKYDAKLSGEEAAKKIDVMGSGLSLSFVLPSRDGSFQTPPTLEAETEALEALPLTPAPSLFEDEETLEETETQEPFEPTLASTTDQPHHSLDPYSENYQAKLLDNLARGTSISDPERDDQGDDQDQFGYPTFESL